MKKTIVTGKGNRSEEKRATNGEELRNSLPQILRRLLIGWFTGAFVELLLLLCRTRTAFGAEVFEQMSFLRVAVVTWGIFGILTVSARFGYGTRRERWERWGMLLIFTLLSAVAVGISFHGTFLWACAIVFWILLIYCLKGWDGREKPALEVCDRNHGAVFAAAGLSFLFLLFVSVWTVARVYSFSAPTYDFGIFSQMFYSMKERGLQLTTLERDGLLSHFAVHVSPIYYLLLPFYALAPYPATLQILQGVVLTSGVIPLWKLGKHFGLSSLQRVLLCGILFLYPAFAGGVGYDIHENCFLTPLLLWVFYGIEKGKKGITFVTAFLTLGVKEDAAVYIGVLSLWLVVKTSLQKGKKDKKNMAIGLWLMGISILWFFGATMYLKTYGDGVMSGRYKNMMDGKGGTLLSVVCNVFAHPMKVLYECTDPEKLKYLVLTMVPLLGLPLITRRYERYLLLIPYILVNLLPDYPYQHDIFFQYSFGSTAFLLYLTLANLSDIEVKWVKTWVLSGTAILCGVCFSIVIVPKAMSYPEKWAEERENIGCVREALATIPEEASVTATTFYTVDLSQREILYDLGYATREHLLESEYIVLDPRRADSLKEYENFGRFKDLQAFLSFLEQEGYEEAAEVENRLLIYKKVIVSET